MGTRMDLLVNYVLFSCSAFKEKRWLQQLGIARVLAKKSISNLTIQGGLTASENPPEIVLWKVTITPVCTKTWSNRTSNFNAKVSNNCFNCGVSNNSSDATWIFKVQYYVFSNSITLSENLGHLFLHKEPEVEFIRNGEEQLPMGQYGNREGGKQGHEKECLLFLPLSLSLSLSFFFFCFPGTF